MLPAALRPDGALELVIFDCDGVLIDSEEPSCRMIARDLRQYGREISDDDAVHRFAGHALTALKHEIEQAEGIALPEDWPARMQRNLVTLMRNEAETIDGAPAMLRGVAALGLPYRIGSNSSVAEMEAKFGRTGLDELIAASCIHSARDMGQPKPDPAVYLAGARAQGVAPGNCIVLEDTDTGARAAQAAGMGCVLLRPAELPAPSWPGLLRITHLDEFVPLLRRILTGQGRGDTAHA
ncbi:HAD family phosphatase [Komagataeibacter rhaeticus]|uniref:HAD family hydrolase n=1 Tax=Komagataeibacter rhaeticus TaxID=215221 RepID=UPI0004D41C20|nr:HAD family phosphatase [Komagataeibacter rhaeticus]KDU97567.1 phosphatase [Komagataeibacter rhaeticus AF1]MBL7240840.1 HAD family phosphatase [Komagataeibacter rhaeticus]PYD54903.1 HAD family phosphatase [Komagataeibacter rhaeticus]GBQ12471.1 phosphatase [Komagataeibacter rhaeticus DSM 16663]